MRVGVRVGIEVLVGKGVLVKVGGIGVFVGGIGLFGNNVTVDVLVKGTGVEVGNTLTVEQAEIINMIMMSNEKY